MQDEVEFNNVQNDVKVNEEEYGEEIEFDDQYYLMIIVVVVVMAMNLIKKIMMMIKMMMNDLCIYFSCY